MGMRSIPKVGHSHERVSLEREVVGEGKSWAWRKHGRGKSEGWGGGWEVNRSWEW